MPLSYSTIEMEQATGIDFCEIFRQDMNALYSLAFLLTGDAVKAEQCFVAGLEDCVSGASVFKEGARSWSRGTIIKNAIRALAPIPSSEARIGIGQQLPAEGVVVTGLEAVRQLKAFERFVFVMSFLERYSDRECAFLLNRSLHEVESARRQAMRNLAMGGNQAELIDAGLPQEAIAADRQPLCV